MAAINKNFVIKNGLEVDTKTLYVDANTRRVGVGSTNPTVDLDVVGKLKVQDGINTPNLVVGIETAGTIGVSTLTATGLVATAATITTLTASSFGVTGNSTIGDSTSDTVTINAQVASNLEPSTTDIYDVGSTSKRWRDINIARTINTTNLVGIGLSVGVGTARSYVSSELVVSGVSTFTNGPVLVGSGTSTGTATQRLQITGGAYVSGNVGIGITNPGTELQVAGGGAGIRITDTTALSGDLSNTGWLIKQELSNAAFNSSGLEISLDSGAADFVITSGGLVGIGIVPPTSQLHVVGNQGAEYAATFLNDGNNANRLGIRIQCGVDTGSGTAISIQDGDGTVQGSVTFNAGTVTYGTFTANHDCIIPSYSDQIPYGTLMIINNITYKKRSDGTDLERGILYDAGISTTAYAKNLLGAYSYEYDESSPAQQGSDLSVHQVLVLGDGHIRCCGETGNIKVGDGITSSSVEGVGMKMDKIGMVIGIAQEDVDFVGNEIKLVSVQYGLHQYIPDNISDYIENLMSS